MIDDEVVTEVRKVREEHAARFNYDLRAIFTDLQRSEAARDRTDSPLVSAPKGPVEPPEEAVQRIRMARR